MAMRLQEACRSLDEVVDRAPVISPQLYQEHADHACTSDSVANVSLIGWDEDADRPGCYMASFWTDGSTTIERIREASPDPVQKGVLTAQKGICGTPIPSPEFADEHGFRNPRDLDRVDAELELLHLIEISRREMFDDRFWGGGQAVLTTVMAGAIDQRVIMRWCEDQVGEYFTPHAKDIHAWRAARSITSAQIPTGLSRLQRERMKKARKGTLRSV
jgi:hypothetical protein